MKIINNFPILPWNRLDVKEIIRHLQLYARGQLDEVVKHHNLAKWQQPPGERFEDFLISRRDLTKTCSFCNKCTDLIVCDKIVTSVIDVKIRRKLWQFFSEIALLTRQLKSVGLTKLRISMCKSLQKTDQPTRMQITYKKNTVLLVVHALPVLTQASWQI